MALETTVLLDAVYDEAFNFDDQSFRNWKAKFRALSPGAKQRIVDTYRKNGARMAASMVA